MLRMRLRVVLHHFGVFLQGFFSPFKAKSSYAQPFCLRSFGVCLYGVLGGQIRRQRSCGRVSSYRSGVSVQDWVQN
jgi:hypothetical protein